MAQNLELMSLGDYNFYVFSFFQFNESIFFFG
uniref:Uncharacterized protein n=1 Tax=Rhizophora mucronata TaxID=61149 RepID=A0A2P2NVV5_RHIMU